MKTDKKERKQGVMRGTRISPPVAEAMRRAATAEDRSESSVIRLALEEWLKKHGWLE